MITYQSLFGFDVMNWHVSDFSSYRINEHLKVIMNHVFKFFLCKICLQYTNHWQMIYTNLFKKLFFIDINQKPCTIILKCCDWLECGNVGKCSLHIPPNNRLVMQPISRTFGGVGEARVSILKTVLLPGTRIILYIYILYIISFINNTWNGQCHNSGC
jgi:hypothetical protein